MRLNTAVQVDNDARQPTITQYDHLVVQAFQAGRLMATTTTNRRQADLPMTCPEPDQVEAFWQLVIAKEKQVQELFHDAGLQQHGVSMPQLRTEFNQLVAHPRMCLVNVTAILHNVTWNALWDELNGNILPRTLD